MAYWSEKPSGNDYAAGSVGVNILSIKKRMLEGIDKVIEKSHPEQGLIASLQCIRLIASEFPKNVAVHFGKKELQQAKDKFHEWYEKVHTKIPKKYREDVLKSAEVEFERFEREVLNVSKGE